MASTDQWLSTLSFETLFQDFLHYLRNGSPMDETILNVSAAIMVLCSLPTFLALVFGTAAPYGRYAPEAKSIVYKPQLNAKFAWFVQEVPSFLVAAALGYFGKEECMSSTVNRILLGLYLTHYFQRSFIFPFLIRGGKPTPVLLCLMAFGFCMWNGFQQGRYLTHYYTYDESWLSHPMFIIGVIMFVSGMAINIHSDHILRNLRKPGEQGYKIPRGGMFEYVSGANFFGEILEWAGFAVCNPSPPAIAFAFFTFCNIGPRGKQHHEWYLKKFENYPKGRKGVIPFLW
ncbi:3-oxo-5-alpha-steroid 4-dehydrogenase 1 [Balamuthia mandrillaris]